MIKLAWFYMGLIGFACSAICPGTSSLNCSVLPIIFLYGMLSYNETTISLLNPDALTQCLIASKIKGWGPLLSVTRSKNNIIWKQCLQELVLKHILNWRKLGQQRNKVCTKKILLWNSYFLGWRSALVRRIQRGPMCVENVNKILVTSSCAR